MVRAGSSLAIVSVLWALAVLPSGCAGGGRVVELDVRAPPSDDGGPPSRAQSDRLKIVVKPFVDARRQQDHLGTRTHLGGGITVFRVEDGPAGEVVAQVLADHLAQRGWNATVGEADGRPDVVISGTLLGFSVDAKSRFGSTVMQASLSVGIRAENTADGSATTMSLEDSREDTVFWFDPEDLEELVDEMLRESVRNMLAGVHVSNGILRVK